MLPENVNVVGTEPEAMLNHVMECHEALRTLRLELDGWKQRVPPLVGGAGIESTIVAIANLIGRAAELDARLQESETHASRMSKELAATYLEKVAAQRAALTAERALAVATPALPTEEVE